MNDVNLFEVICKVLETNNNPFVITDLIINEKYNVIDIDKEFIGNFKYKTY